MSKEIDRKLVDSMTQLMTRASISAILVEEMGEKLTEMMGQEAFEDWLAPVGEKAAIRAMATVSQARRIAEDETGTTFTKVFGEEETFS